MQPFPDRLNIPSLNLFFQCFNCLFPILHAIFIVVEIEVKGEIIKVCRQLFDGCFFAVFHCFLLVLFQIFLGNLEIVTSPLDFFTPCDKNRPWTNADKINLLALIKQAQSLLPAYHRQCSVRAGILIFQILFVLFQQNCTPCVCLDSEDAIMLFDLFLTGEVSCRAILKQRINPFTQPMPLPCAFLCQRQNIIFQIPIFVHFRKTDHAIRQTFDLLLCFPHQAIDFFRVFSRNRSRQIVGKFFRCRPVIQLVSKVYNEISLAVVKNGFVPFLVRNQLFSIFHRRHALHTPFCHRRFQFFKKISSGQSNRIHRIFQFFQFLAACPACYIRERVVRSINAKCRANRKCNAFRFCFFGKLVFFLAALFHLVAVMQHGMSNLMDHRLDGLALTHIGTNTDFFVHVAVITFCVALDLSKTNWHRRYLFDCLFQQGIILDTGSQFIHFQRRQRFSVCLGIIENRCYPEPGNHPLHHFDFRLPALIQHRKPGVLVDFLPLFPFLYRGRRDDLDALFTLFHIAVKLIFPGIVPSHQRSIWTLHCDQQRIIEAVIVEFRHCKQVLRIHFRSKNVLYALF